MQYAIGDLWDYAQQGYAVVIPINIGWTRDLHNVMGRGVAQQAAARFPGLSKAIGSLCFQFREAMPPVAQYAFDGKGHTFLLIPFPVKPLAPTPSLSWKQPASLDLIRRSAMELVDLVKLEPKFGKVALPLVGCGNGGLSRDAVLPVLQSILVSDSFTLVEQPSSLSIPDHWADLEDLIIP